MNEATDRFDWPQWGTLVLALVLFAAWMTVSALGGCAQLAPLVQVAAPVAGDVSLQRTEEAIERCSARDPAPQTPEDREACLREELGDLSAIVDVCEAGAVAGDYLNSGGGGDGDGDGDGDETGSGDGDG